MNFSPLEQKFLARMRRYQIFWKKVRWLALAISLAFIVCPLVEVLDLQSQFHSAPGSGGHNPDNIDIMLFLMIWPLIWIQLACGGAILEQTLAEWNGRSTEILLLKLIDQFIQSEPSSKPPM